MVDEKFFEKPETGSAWDVIIIGSGPSALTAAIYTTRGAASTLVAAGEAWGGQLMLTTDVDNFPGFPDGIQGPALMDNMRKQVERFHAEIVDKNAQEVSVDTSPFEIKIADQIYKANSVIIATGAQTQWLGVPGEDELRGKGVSSCAPCDAPFFKEKRVIVVGGGDSAMEEAIVLTKYASEVILIHRRDAFRASAAMQKKVFDNKKIKIIWNTEVVEMQGDNVLGSVKLKTKRGSEQEKLIEGERKGEDESHVYWEKQIDGLFVAIGHRPTTEIFKGKIDLDEKGYIKKVEQNEFKMSTSVKGVFVAGDVHDFHYRQAITAASFGCMAGMEALKFLDKNAPSY